MIEKIINNYNDNDDDDDNDADYARLSTDVLASLPPPLPPFKHFHRFSLCEHYVNHLLTLGSGSMNCHIYMCECVSHKNVQDTFNLWYNPIFLTKPASDWFKGPLLRGAREKGWNKLILAERIWKWVVKPPEWLRKERRCSITYKIQRKRKTVEEYLQPSWGKSVFEPLYGAGSGQ